MIAPVVEWLRKNGYNLEVQESIIDGKALFFYIGSIYMLFFSIKLNFIWKCI